MRLNKEKPSKNVEDRYVTRGTKGDRQDSRGSKTDSGWDSLHPSNQKRFDGMVRDYTRDSEREFAVQEARKGKGDFRYKQDPEVVRDRMIKEMKQRYKK